MMGTLSRLALCSAVVAALVSPASAQQRSRQVQPGWIGISLDVPTVDGKVVADSDVFIGDVRRGSPAEEAGLRAGDRLLSIGDLRGAEDFRDLPDRLQLVVGERVRIRFERDGRRREIVLRAAERPADMSPRTVRLALQPDSMVEAMVRAMDSMRVQLVRGVQERDAKQRRNAYLYLLRPMLKNNQVSLGVISHWL
jgi:C-terminal processing protease CtpA/Prc